MTCAVVLSKGAGLELSKKRVSFVIVVFGSLNVDMVMPVESLPRAGETVLSHEYRLGSGGKGANQAVAAARVGSEVYMYGAVGNDDFGKLIRSALTSFKVDIDGVKTLPKPTGCASICVDHTGENFITVASGANMEAVSGDVPDEKLTEETTLLLQMEVRPQQNWALVERAHRRGVRTVLNLAPAHAVPRDILEKVSILVLNKIESLALAEDLGLECHQQKEIALELSKAFKNICIVTLGGEGAFASDGENLWRANTLGIIPVDTTGAGDAFVGVIASCLDRGYSLPEALASASVAGGLSCLKVGAQSSLPDKEKIAAQLSKVVVSKEDISTLPEED